MPRALSLSIAAALLISVPAFPAGEPAAAAGALSLLKQIDLGFVQVFEKVAPSVVVIDAVRKSDDDDETGLPRFERFFQKCAEHPVPDNECTSVVLIQVFYITGMVYPVM